MTATVRWKVIGASVRGASHKQNGTVCQDASAWQTSPGRAFLAVADGGGAYPRSEEGSTRAVARVREWVAALEHSPLDWAPDSWIREVFADVGTCLASAAREIGAATRDYSTTLAVVVADPYRVCMAQVGDSIAVVRDESGYRVVSPPPRFEYANETSFVTDHDAASSIRVDVLDAATVREIVLSTDGLRFQILDSLSTCTPYTPFYQDVTDYARAADSDDAAVARFLEELTDQSGDDKSLVIAVRLDEPD